MVVGPVAPSIIRDALSNLGFPQNATLLTVDVSLIAYEARRRSDIADLRELRV